MIKNKTVPHLDLTTLTSYAIKIDTPLSTLLSRLLASITGIEQKGNRVRQGVLR